MSMQLSVSGVKEIAAGVWSAVVERSELDFLGGRPSERGDRSVVLVTNADFHKDTLQIRPSGSTVVSLGRTNEVVFVDRFESLSHLGCQVAESTLENSEMTNLMRQAPDGGPNFYWVTVGKGLQENYELALGSGVWGVDSKYRARIQAVRDGDFIVFYGKEIGFSLCKVSGAYYEDRSRVWPDGVYPYRVKIAAPQQHSRDLSLSDVFQSLKDPEARSYRNVNAAGRAIGGAAGVFRPVSMQERQHLFPLLGWPVDPDGDN